MNRLAPIEGDSWDYNQEKESDFFIENDALNRLMKFYPLLETRSNARNRTKHEKDNTENFFESSYRRSFKKDNYRPPMCVYESAINTFLSLDHQMKPTGLETAADQRGGNTDLTTSSGSSQWSYESLRRRAFLNSKPDAQNFKPKSWVDYAHSELGKKYKWNPSITKAKMDFLAKSKAYTSRKIVQSIIRDP